MPSDEKRAREMALQSIKMTESTYSDVCKKMAKEASPEKKKEIEDIQTKKLMKIIKKQGIEQTEAQFKVGIQFYKLMRKSDKIRKAHRTEKNKKRNENRNRKSTCKYIKRHGTYGTKWDSSV
jgi:hypothetical protein